LEGCGGHNSETSIATIEALVYEAIGGDEEDLVRRLRGDSQRSARRISRRGEISPRDRLQGIGTGGIGVQFGSDLAIIAASAFLKDGLDEVLRPGGQRLRG